MFLDVNFEKFTCHNYYWVKFGHALREKKLHLLFLVERLKNCLYFFTKNLCYKPLQVCHNEGNILRIVSYHNLFARQHFNLIVLNKILSDG